jgi:GNAT superfamily N-acetyltransferase
MGLAHCTELHQLYAATPGYFELLGTRVPTSSEVERDVQTALFDPRRHLELLRQGNEVVGCLDYKLDFPESGDVTINLLLIRGGLQSSGLGAWAISDLERRLPPGTCRLLASVLGTNPRAVAFWERLGFAFATDARPVMTWYAKPLRVSVPT